MKKIFLIVTFLFSIHNLIACCAGGMISIAPRSENIAQNPIILLDFMERDFKIYEKISKANFHLVDENGNKIGLKIVEANKGFHTMAQVLLKPSKNLSIGIKVSIQISGIEEITEQQEKFVQRVQRKKWEVAYEKDITAPTFSDSISFRTVDHSNSSAPGCGITGQVKSSDNYDYSYQKNDKIANQILIEATNEIGERYFLIINDERLWIYEGICGAKFKVDYNTIYNYSLKLMDFSGNKSKEVKEISFKVEYEN